MKRMVADFVVALMYLLAAEHFFRWLLPALDWFGLRPFSACFAAGALIGITLQLLGSLYLVRGGR